MLRSRRARLAQGCSLLTIAAAIAAQPASAQEVITGEGQFLGTIYVTGENIVRELADTSSSVAVIGADEIADERAGKDDVQGVVEGTPNVLYNGSVSTPVFRGVNAEGPQTGAYAFFGGTVPRATINVDGHYQNYNELYFGATSVWDVDTIEVFRGPQTTVQGANAIAGAIIVNTKDPAFYREGAYRLEYGNYNQRRASFMYNAPISEQVAARIALDYTARDTFIDYTSPTFLQNEFGQNFKNFNGRAKLLWAPADIMGLEVMLTYSRTKSNRPSIEGAGPPYEDLESPTGQMPSWEQTTDTAILDVEYEFDNGWLLTNQSQYSQSDVDRRVGMPSRGDADVLEDSYTNETLLSFGQPGDQVSGVMGLWTAYTTADETLDQGGISTFKDQKHNLGLFGELAWRMTDRWTVTGGLRYERDKIQRTGDVSPVFANSDLDYNQTFNEVLPKLSVAYDFSDDLTVGALVKKGYNPGGVSLDFVSTKTWQSFEPETVWDYELFTRASFLGDRLFVNGNLFFMDYTNAQQNITQQIDGLTYIHTINAESAQSYGLELSVDYQPFDTLTLRSGLGLLNTEFTDFPQSPALEGNAFASAPGAMFSLGASWNLTERFSIGGDLRYVDGYYSDVDNTPTYEVEGYTLVDLQASYSVNDAVEFYGYVNNLFDERTPVLLQPARGAASAFTQASLTTPRMLGIGIRGTF
ncbi:TonB-dependent receptor [Chachezhania antarctica]|uniref:TonB-dependent receptor n=1 Tax=Chachezhania antarctica TaxID=2340860 RepID=UPI000EAEA7AF|nr:TonB-dependent receptor [Chachezhania antarctica]|tara:strand:+ start:3919 stop:6009 length:2091 start_codon:yes stop_codon:yes gene_type:complete